MLLSSSHASSFLCPSSVTSILGVQEGFLNAIISHISVYIEGHSRRKIGATVFHISSITQCSQISLFSFKIPISIWTIQAWKLSIRLISAFRKRNLSLELAWILRFSLNILARVDHVFLSNFHSQMSKTKFRHLYSQFNHFRITQAQFFLNKIVDLAIVCPKKWTCRY